MNYRLAVVLPLFATCLSFAADSNFGRANYTVENDTISVIFNDARFPVDDFDLPLLQTTHINNLYIGFYDGLTGYYFNSFVQGGNSPLVLIGEMTVSGVAPNQTMAMTFADTDPATRFTIDVLFEMLGDSSHAIRGTATITNLLGAQSLTGSKFYLFSDVLVSGGDGGDVTAFDSDSGIFYAYDQTNSPNTWFGCHAEGRDRLHYGGHAYQGPVGLAPFHAAIVAGTNLTDVVESVPQDQVAGWNWDVGTIDDSLSITFAIAAHTSLSSLILALENAVPDPIFTDDFESGTTSEWSAATP